MKPSTIYSKIDALKAEFKNDMDTLTIELAQTDNRVVTANKIDQRINSFLDSLSILQQQLSEAIDNAIAKERLSLIKKVAKVCDIDPEDLEKKILPKAKRQCNAEKIKEIMNKHKNQAIMFSPIVHNGKQYFYVDKQYGTVIERFNNKPIIVGYMDNGAIKFT